MDDADQHRKVKGSTYILLTKFTDLYTDDFILPTGNLRESKRGAKRADVIVVTKCPKNLSEKKKVEIVKKINPKANQQVFFTTISYDNNLKGSETALKITDLKQKEVLLVTGIANPTSLLTFLSEEKINFKHLEYPDHYDFTDKDILKIKREFKNLSASNSMILTTEKDYMRLEGKLKNLSYISIKSTFLNKEKAFNTFIFNEIHKIK